MFFDGCGLDFGRPFPAQIQGPATLAPDLVRGALAFMRSRSIAADGQKALEAQYGIWLLQGAQGVPPATDTTREVVAAAGNRPANPQGTSLLDAARSGQITLQMDSWQAVGDRVAVGGGRMDHFYGRGRLSLENTSGQSVTLYLPIGTVWPPANPADQNIVAFQSRVEVQNTVLRGQAGGGIRVAAPVLLAAGAAGLGVLLRRERKRTASGRLPTGGG